MKRSLIPVSSKRMLLSGAVLEAQKRFVGSEYKAITKPGSPLPPSTTPEAVVPLDFSPHIEWYEYPKEMFNPHYPFTLEQVMRNTEETFERDMEDMADQYGVRVTPAAKWYYWLVWAMYTYLGWFQLWGAYRSVGFDPRWQQWVNIVESDPDCPTMQPDDVYQDMWIAPEQRGKTSRWNNFWRWRPPVKSDGAEDVTFKLPLEHQDPVEWIHMTSKS